MALFAISDLHLSFGTNKPMDIFGKSWEGYEEKLKESWNSLICEDDYVVLNGDFSWATYIDDAKADFEYLSSLNGIKYLSKGNHDYWWTTANKQKQFVLDNHFSNINFLHNNYFMYKDIAVCGTRGWQSTGDEKENEKMFNRESERLRLSINQCIKENPSEIIVALHYPPVSLFVDIMKQYKVTNCIYGHLHGDNAFGNVRDEIVDNIKYKLVSCDYLNFTPYKIKD